MAEAVSKSSMFSPCLHHHRISVSPSGGLLRGLPSLNMKPLLLRSSTSSSSSSFSSSSSSQFYGQSLVAVSRRGISHRRNLQSFCAQMSLRIGKAQRWWEKGVKPNMKEITSAQDLVHSLLNAGDKLVVVDFFSPGCGGCKALHPKICQLAEMNPEVQFLQVNYEEHKSMCYSLNVHVLPFFRFYRGTQGRLCSFSCTNATIKKFKDALAKHTPDRCSLGPPKGLEEKELLALSANKDLSFNYAPKPVEAMPVPAEEKILAETSATSQSRSKPPPLPPLLLHLPLTAASTSSRESEEKTLANAGR